MKGRKEIRQRRGWRVGSFKNRLNQVTLVDTVATHARGLKLTLIVVIIIIMIDTVPIIMILGGSVVEC
jgi:hypothetical protein